MENLKLREMKHMTLIDLKLHSKKSNFYVVLFCEITGLTILLLLLRLPIGRIFSGIHTSHL